MPASMYQTLVAVMLLLFATIAHAGALTPFIADYTVSASWFPLGDARFTLKRAAGEDCYVYRYVAKAAGAVSVFRGDVITETSHFCVVDDDIRPQRDVFRHQGGDEEDNFTLVFDWDAMTVTNQATGETRALPPDGLDRQVIQLWLRRKLAGAGGDLPTEPFKVSLVDDDRNTTYTLKVMGHETVEVPMGTFDVVRVDRVDTDEKVVRFWLAPKLAYLPIKVVHDEDGQPAIVLELKALPRSPTESADSATDRG